MSTSAPDRDSGSGLGRDSDGRIERDERLGRDRDGDGDGRIERDERIDRDGDASLEVQNSEEFADLRRRFRAFVFPMTALFLGWYFLYVLLAVFAHGFMAHKLIGNVTVGIVFGLLQFVSTFAITMAYRRWADRNFDPRAEELAARMGARA